MSAAAAGSGQQRITCKRGTANTGRYAPLHMKTAAAAACAALVLAAFPPPGAGQPAAAQRAQESGKAPAPLVDVAQPQPGVAS